MIEKFGRIFRDAVWVRAKIFAGDKVLDELLELVVGNILEAGDN